MAAGDVISAISSVTAAGSYVIQPGAGAEWVIHNIYHSDHVGLCVTNGTVLGSMSTLNGPNIETNLQFHLTGSFYLVLQCASAQYVGFDGVVTK